MGGPIFLHMGLWLVARLPLSLLRLFGTALGLWWGIVGGKRRRVARTNLRICYPDRPAAWHRRTAAQSLIEEGRNYFEMPYLWAASPRRIKRLARNVTGLDKILDTRKAGRAVVLMTPHLGNWEFTSLFVGMRLPLVCMYRPLKQPFFEAYVLRGREHTGAELVSADRRGIRNVLAATRKGAIAGVLPDHVPKSSDDGVLAPFFGEPAMTSVLVSRLATKSDAKVFCVLAVRRPFGFDLRVIEADEGIYTTDRDAAAAGINASIERCIEEAVAQYWWSYPRFRKRREGAENAY